MSDIPDPCTEEPGYIRMTREEAEEISHALADVLCWFRGFNAARGENAPDVDPPGLDDLRSLNIRIKAALQMGQF